MMADGIVSSRSRRSTLFAQSLERSCDVENRFVQCSSTRSPLGQSGSSQSSQKRKEAAVHSQVVKLRAEDKHLAEDVLEAIEVPKTRLALWHLTAQMRDAFACSARPPMPSPLGLKASQHIPVWDSVQ